MNCIFLGSLVCGIGFIIVEILKQELEHQQYLQNIKNKSSKSNNNN